MKTLQGIAVSWGIGIGKTFVIPEMDETAVARRAITSTELESQWDALQKAIEKVKQDIKSLSDSENKEQNAIFESYTMMLDDVVFLEQVKKTHETSLVSIEYILYTHYNALADSLRETGDEYLSQRADDICDVYGRVINVLIDKKTFDMQSVPENVIVIAKNLKPTDAVLLERKNPLAIVLEEGGVNSHFGILARNFGIPAVFGIKNLHGTISQNIELIVDGERGTIFVEPDKKTKDEYSALKQKHQKQKLKLDEYKNKNGTTKDGTAIHLCANIGMPEDAISAQKQNAEGIGLFRTEFLFMESGTMLSEEKQFEAYRSVLETMQQKRVVIRTLDAGADKVLPIVNELAEEKNPLLGFRGVRVCLSHKEIFKTQLRALLRASVYGKLSILVPLVSTFDELLEVKALLKLVQKELKKAKIPFDEKVPLGIMIETASAAVTADLFAKEADFFSVGTNDLTQYVIGVDRDNARVATLFDDCNPAVLRLIKQTVEVANAKKIPVSVCGEMASRKEGIALLVGMGVRLLSMRQNQLSDAKAFLSKHTIDDLKSIATNCLKMDSASEIHAYLAKTLA